MIVQLSATEPRPAAEQRRTDAPAGSTSESVRTVGGPARPSPPARRTARTLSPRWRKALVAAHVLVGVGWLGITAGKLVLEIVAATSGEPSVARAGFLFMAAFDRAVFPPAAIVTLMTGIILSVGTAWGLFQYWWIVVKLALTVGVVVTGVRFVGVWTEQAIAAAGPVGSPADAAAISSWLIGAAVAHLLMLAAATVISVYKPWGRIRAERDAARRPSPGRAA